MPSDTKRATGEPTRVIPLAEPDLGCMEKKRLCELVPRSGRSEGAPQPRARIGLDPPDPPLERRPLQGGWRGPLA